jgi:hypothetical protein
MGILRITMRKTSSQSVSGAFTVRILPGDAPQTRAGLSNRKAGAIATL